VRATPSHSSVVNGVESFMGNDAVHLSREEVFSPEERTEDSR
jgi:hypothetical protein